MLKKWFKEKIKDWSTTLLQLLLLMVSVVTFVNVVMVYWYVDIFPVSSFTAVWYMIRAFVTQSHYLMVNSFIICFVLFAAVFAIERKKLLFPVLALVYGIYDFINVIVMFVEGIHTGLWKLFLPQLILTAVLIILLIWKCCHTYFKKHPRKKTYY